MSFNLALKQMLLIRLSTDADFAVYIALLMGSLAEPADRSTSLQVGLIHSSQENQVYSALSPSAFSW